MANYFNEATRVQMSAMVHLQRLGYKYRGKLSEDQANKLYDKETNILIDVFTDQFRKLNPDNEGQAEQALKDIRQKLDNDDIGRSFYKRLISVSPIKLIDFDDFTKNEYQYDNVVTNFKKYLSIQVLSNIWD